MLQGEPDTVRKCNSLLFSTHFIWFQENYLPVNTKPFTQELEASCTAAEGSVAWEPRNGLKGEDTAYKAAFKIDGCVNEGTIQRLRVMLPVNAYQNIRAVPYHL